MEDKLMEELTLFRRQLHQNPELGFKEFDTTASLENRMMSLNIPLERIAGTGLIATLTKGDGPIIVLRADMDALPLQEETGLTFASGNKNVMHACGHDLHTTMLLGAAHLLKQSEFNGTVKFVFQPSEEGSAGSPEYGKSGGQIVMESGKLAGASAALAVHVHPLLPVGMIVYKNGMALANIGNFTITIEAAGGHAGAKTNQQNSIGIAGKLISQLSDLSQSRAVEGDANLVFTYINTTGEPNFNILPLSTKIQGTLRALDLDVYQLLKDRMNDLTDHLMETLGCRITTEFSAFYPALNNNAQVHEYLLPVHERIFGMERMIEGQAQLIGEDFAFYAKEIPAQIYFLGAKDPANETYFLHNPKVVFNEECIPLGAKFLAEGALELLQNFR